LVSVAGYEEKPLGRGKRKDEKESFVDLHSARIYEKTGGVLF